MLDHLGRLRVFHRSLVWQVAVTGSRNIPRCVNYFQLVEFFYATRCTLRLQLAAQFRSSTMIPSQTSTTAFEPRIQGSQQRATSMSHPAFVAIPFTTVPFTDCQRTTVPFLEDHPTGSVPRSGVETWAIMRHHTI